MFNSFDTDRPFLERKYHDPDKEFNPFRRMFYHGEGYIESSGLDDKGIKDGLKEKMRNFKNAPHPVARAEAVKFILENQRLYINEHDYFIGFYSLGRLADPYTLHKWDAEASEMKDEELKTVFSDLNASGAVAIWPNYDHVVPDWESLLKLGLKGIKKRAADYCEQFRKTGELTPEKEAFYEAIDIQYSAIIDCIKRAADIAAGLDLPKASRIEKCLNDLSVGAPTNIYEAMQLMLIYFLVSECIDSYQVRSLGNGLDRSLYPFFENDLKKGKFSEEELRELLAYFLMQWSATIQTVIRESSVNIGFCRRAIFRLPAVR